MGFIASKTQRDVETVQDPSLGKRDGQSDAQDTQSRHLGQPSLSGTPSKLGQPEVPIKPLQPVIPTQRAQSGIPNQSVPVTSTPAIQPEIPTQSGQPWIPIESLQAGILSPSLQPGIPTQPVQPGIPTQSVQPGIPTQFVQPGIPIQPVQRIPTQSVQPGIPIQSVQPGIPTQSVQPGIPIQSVQPGIPTESVHPGTPIQSVQPGIPTQSVQPGIPIQSVQPGIPTESVHPGTPIQSVQPGILTQSVKLGIPTQSVQPGIPLQLAQPIISSQSLQPGMPTQSVQPGIPIQSVQPAIPTQSVQDNQDNQSGQTGTQSIQQDQSKLSGLPTTLEDNECTESMRHNKPAYNEDGIGSDQNVTSDSITSSEKEDTSFHDEDFQNSTNVKVIIVQSYDPEKNFHGFGNIINSPSHDDDFDKRPARHGLGSGDGCRKDDISDTRHSASEDCHGEIGHLESGNYIDQDVTSESINNTGDSLDKDAGEVAIARDSCSSDEDDISDIECLTAENLPRCKSISTDIENEDSEDENHCAPSSDDNAGNNNDISNAPKRSQGTNFRYLDDAGNGDARVVCIPASSCDGGGDDADDKTSCRGEVNSDSDDNDECNDDEDDDDDDDDSDGVCYPNRYRRHQWNGGSASGSSCESLGNEADAVGCDYRKGSVISVLEEHTERKMGLLKYDAEMIGSGDDYDAEDDLNNLLTAGSRNTSENTPKQKRDRRQSETTVVEEDTDNGERTTRQVPFPVDLDVMEFIFNSNYQDKFLCFLEDKGINFNWTAGAKVAHIECHGDESECVEALSSFLDDVQSSDITVEEVFWKCVEPQISTICSKLGDSPPLLKPLAKEMKIRIVSFKSDIDYHRKCLKAELKRIEKEAAFDCKTFPIPSSYDAKNFILLLQKIKFKDKYLKPDCKDVEVIFDDKNAEIRLKGPKFQLEIAMERFEEQGLATAEKQLKLPQSILQFLISKTGQEAIEKTLEHHKIEAIVIFDDPAPSKPFSAKVLGYANEAITPISEIAVERKFDVEESNSRLTATPDWRNLCEEIRTENEVLIRKSDSGSAWILTGVEKNVSQAASRLQEFLDKNSIEDDDYACTSSKIAEYLIKHCAEDLKIIETNLEEFDVRFLGNERHKFCLSGRRKGLEDAKIKLDELIHSLVLRSVDKRGPGLRKYFEDDGKGERWVKALENNYKCFIQVEKKFVQKQDISYFVTSQGHTISWKIGDIAKEQVHTLVSPQGACTDAILNSSPEVRQFLGAVKAGEIFVSPGFNLPCRHVLLTSCSNWNGGNGEECLRTIVQKSLQKVDELKGRSIAFPAIGTGKLQFPPTEAARIMLDETLQYCAKNATSNVKDIRFLLFHSSKAVIDAFTQEINHCQSPVSQTGEETWYENVEIVQGDLTKESQSDAILNVLASDMNMNRDGSLSAAVARAAGSGLEEEFRGFLQQNERPAAAITSGALLNVPHVIHIIPRSSGKQDIKDSLEQGLLLAKQNGIRSISLPAVGTGWYGLSASDSASIIFQALSNGWESYTGFSKVRIAILQPGLMPAFQKKKQRHLKPLTIDGGSRRNTKMRHVNIEVVDGDLTNENSDAIVNIINSDMNMENAGELSKAIARVCGLRVKQECEQLGQQQGGSVVMTSGGNLNVRHIIHLIPESSDVKHLQTCLEKCLQLADSNGFRSVSLPAIGTGGYGMSPVISANLTFQALETFSKTCAKLQNVRIVIKQKPMVEAFRQEQKRHDETSAAATSTNLRNQTIRINFMGKNQESVDKAVNEFNRDFIENCTFEEVKDEGVSRFSENQIKMLIKEAEKCDVEMTVEGTMGCIALRGNKDEVHSMTKMINKEISEARESEKKRQEGENARMISKTIQWSYELEGKKLPFDFKSNLEIEKAYSNGDRSVEVSSGGEKFVIDVQEKTGYTKPQNLQITVKRKLKEAEGISLPEHWDQMPSDNKDVHTVLLDVNSPEYKDVSELFFATCTGIEITSIERIQNPLLYRTYVLKKEKMDKITGGKTEHRLFHGTHADSVTPINTQGFNRSLCGRHGTRFGKGVYFARDASLSLNYTKKEDVQRYMYLAKVLVGQYCQGAGEMKVPPPKDSNRPEILYDSTVDKTVNPEQFVIYHDNQCYPDYLITFRVL